MASVSPEILILRQLKAGRTHRAERTWPAVRPLCEVPDDIKWHGHPDKIQSQLLRFNPWQAAANSPRPAVALDWLARKSDYFKLIPPASTARLGTVLSGLGEVKNLSVADWLVTSGQVPLNLNTWTLDSLFMQAIKRPDSRGIDWLFGQKFDLQPLMDDVEDPLLFRILGNTHASGGEVVIQQMLSLVKKGIKPAPSASLARGFEQGVSTLDAMADSYIQMHQQRWWLAVDQARATQTEGFVVTLWQALIAGGDDPEKQSSFEPDATVRQRISHLPLGMADRAMVLATRTLDDREIMAPAPKRRMRS